MAESEGTSKLIPAEETEMTEQQTPSGLSDEFKERQLDEDFWEKVREKVENNHVSWPRAMDETRAERLIDKYSTSALFVLIHKWPNMEEYNTNPELLPSLERLVGRLTEIILEKAPNKKYKHRVEELPGEPTLLHLAVEQNFLHVSQCLVKRYPGLLYIPTLGKEKDLPVELALKRRNDETAAYLISQMISRRVRKLFLCSEDGKNQSKFSFGEIISYHNPKTNKYGMKKTVLAVLDKLIHPRWSCLPDHDENGNKEDIQSALETGPDDPMSYDFHYHILEADENGRQPMKKSRKIGEDCYEFVANPDFNESSLSCLRRIADTKNKEAVQHPVVRMLVARKWNEFAYKWFCIKAAFYVLFLAVLSFALIYGSTCQDPTQYNDSADKFRAFCEVCSVIFLMIHLFEEIDEIAREGIPYFRVRHNYFDLLGIILILIVLPLRFAEVKVQWSLAAIGYIFNFLRLFKFSNVTRFLLKCLLLSFLYGELFLGDILEFFTLRTTGLYTTTLVNIIKRDITRFMAFFSVIFIGFCGAVYMALKVDDMQHSFSNFAWLMLAGFRALVEQQPLAEDYEEKNFGWLVIVILLTYMGIVIVILLNILIAQLSYTYSEAKKIAKLQYAADTMRIVTRLEFSRFANWNLRMKNYVDGGWINDEDLAEEILEDTEDRNPWETVEDRIISVREIMGKILRRKQKDPLETDHIN